MLDSDELEWLEDEVQRLRAPYLLVGTSLPLLLPHGVHDFERIVTVACAGRWGRTGRLFGEKIREAAQLSHWIAFPESFARVLKLLRTAGSSGGKGVIVLSGDVHFSYSAQVRVWPDGSAPAVPTHQLVSSPLCHELENSIAGALRTGASRTGRHIGQLASMLAGAPKPALEWTIESGPWFNNVISTLHLDPNGATVRFERTCVPGELGTRLETVAERPLT